jgi:hypothetical protein
MTASITPITIMTILKPDGGPVFVFRTTSATLARVSPGAGFLDSKANHPQP